MFPWSPDTHPHSNSQSGIAMVISLILLLVITAMGVGIAYVASVHTDLVAAVVNKPLSIDAGETCFDNAIEWLSKPAGQSFANGPTGVKLELAGSGGPLVGKTVLGDTIPLGQTDQRTAKFKDRVGRATYNSCTVEKIQAMNNGSSGNEIGSSNGYGASNFIYTIRITADGSYNLALNGSVIDKNYWQSNSSRSVLEAVVQYSP